MKAPLKAMSKEDNRRLTQVRAGTEMGDLLRRYWWAVGTSADVKDKPTFVRVLGEDLVLFRDGQGRPGLVGAFCSHRRANLCLGHVERDGLRCRYHGWKYDVEGNLLRAPGEPSGSELYKSVKHKAYRCQELGGIVFAYMGPDPAPLLPRYDFLAAPGERYVAIIGFSKCHWLQNVENGMDPYHASFTHGETWDDLNTGPSFLEFIETDIGIGYHTFQPTEMDGVYLRREHHLVMPGISVGAGGLLRGTLAKGGGGMEGGLSNLKAHIKLPTSARFTTPMDETSAMMTRINWKPADSPVEFKREPHPNIGSWKSYDFEPYKEQKAAGTNFPTLGYDWASTIDTQDAIVLDSLPVITDRENENLSEIDRGMVQFRNMHFRAMDDVKAGRDPMGVIRDPKQNEIVTVTATEEIMTKDQFMAARKRILANA